MQDPHNNRIAQWLGVKGDATGVFEGDDHVIIPPSRHLENRGHS